MIYQDCPHCEAAGEVDGETCPVCEGDKATWVEEDQ